MSEKKILEPILNSHKRFRKSEINKALNQRHETSNNSIEQSELENELENANEENSPNNQFIAESGENDDDYELDDDEEDEEDEEDEYGDDDDYLDQGGQFANNENSFIDYQDEFESEETTLTKLSKKESSTGGQARSNKRKRNLSPIPGSTATKSNSNSSANNSGFEIYEKSDSIQVNCNSFIGESKF